MERRGAETRVYYCKKCNADRPGQICPVCGASIGTPQNERIKWRYIRTPLSDTPTMLGVLKALTLTVAALLLAIFIGELIFSTDKQRALSIFSKTNLLPAALAGWAACVAIFCLVLILQGREELHFVLDAKGAHLQVWIIPSRLRCLARMIPYDPYKFTADSEGIQRLLVSETHLLWADVYKCRFHRRACRIDLFRPAGFRFLSIYPEREEMGEIEAYITPKMKQLAKR